MCSFPSMFEMKPVHFLLPIPPSLHAPSRLPLPPSRSKLTVKSFLFCYAEYPTRPFLSKAIIWLVIVAIMAFGAPIKFQKISFSGSVIVFQPSGNGIGSCYFIIHDGLILFLVFLQTNFIPTWVRTADVQRLVKQYHINLSCPMQIFQMRTMFQDC